MNLSDRLADEILITGLPIFHPNRGISFHISPQTMTGAALAEAITSARHHLACVQQSIEAMSEALDSGETAIERDLRTETEDLNPQLAAARYGWFAIEAFAMLCDPGANGFAQHIKHCKGHIVKPRSLRLRGAFWEQYPGQGFYWADHFDFADDWADALKKARKEQVEALHKKYS